MVASLGSRQTPTSQTLSAARLRVHNDVKANLEHVEGLELDVLALVPKEIHHHLQIRLARDIPGHHVEVRTVQEDLSEEFERLPFGDVIVREN